ncbi:lysine transporter LysE [Loktanella sp. 3ANDIMAR09]|uniref:LysE family translocator n=1 Tax=Loktanella sp. 3ANDIMAR09 TaxID=1225657 RepID=UPI0006F3283D|nr:LysE family translocator [Loktanella sp. 3ANDIMAR09]KQI70000.1 lysine transporter LysE [Loktanella sp. 3ANDIMAR09]
MTQLTIALILFLAPLAYSPGPGNMFFAANGARFGFRATVPANLGYHAATLVVTIGIGLGFDWISREAPMFLAIIRFAGAAYVLYLAWMLARAGVMSGNDEAKPASVMDGAILLLLNPKAYLIIALMFTQFAGAADMHRTASVIWIAAVFTVNNAVAFSIYAALGDGMTARWRSPDTARFLNLSFAAILAGVAIWMLLA